MGEDVTSPTTPTTEVTKVGEQPKTFRQNFMEDVHINASGLFMFICGAIAIFWKQHKPEMQELTVLGATYLFASAKNKR